MIHLLQLMALIKRIRQENFYFNKSRSMEHNSLS